MTGIAGMAGVTKMTGMTKRAEIKNLKCLIVMHTKGNT